MAEPINLGTINFYGRVGGGSGYPGPDFNVDYNQDFRAAEPEESDE